MQLLAEGLRFLRGIDSSAATGGPPLRLYGSCFVPSRQLLARMRFRPWNGVFLDETYLSSVEAAEAVTCEAMRLYAEFGVETLVETAITSRSEWENAERLLLRHTNGSPSDDVFGQLDVAVKPMTTLPATDAEQSAAARLAAGALSASSTDRPTKRPRAGSGSARVSHGQLPPTAPSSSVAISDSVSEASEGGACEVAQETPPAPMAAPTTTARHTRLVPPVRPPLRRPRPSHLAARRRWHRFGRARFYMAAAAWAVGTGWCRAGLVTESLRSLDADLAVTVGWCCAVLLQRPAAARRRWRRRQGLRCRRLTLKRLTLRTLSSPWCASAVPRPLPSIRLRARDAAGGAAGARCAQSGCEVHDLPGHLLYEPSRVVPGGWYGGHWGTLMPFLKACERPPAAHRPSLFRCPVAARTRAWPASDRFPLDLAEPPTLTAAAGATGRSRCSPTEVSEQAALEKMHAFVYSAPGSGGACCVRD